MSSLARSKERDRGRRHRTIHASPRSRSSRWRCRPRAARRRLRRRRPKSRRSRASADDSTATRPRRTSGSGRRPARRSAGGLAAAGAIEHREGGSAQLTKFAACMRTNGVPNFPDPNSAGRRSRSARAGIDPSSPQFQAGAAGVPEAPAERRHSRARPQQAKVQAAGARVLRLHALARRAELPRPAVHRRRRLDRIALRGRRGQRHRPAARPQFQAAQQACQARLCPVKRRGGPTASEHRGVRSASRQTAGALADGAPRTVGAAARSSAGAVAVVACVAAVRRDRADPFGGGDRRRAAAALDNGATRPRPRG